jgi:exodeoxyribonuclease-3
VDLFRQFHGDEKHCYTWWSYLEKARMGNRGWRIDYICATKNLAKKFRSCDILDDVTGSDHCPVVAEL